MSESVEIDVDIVDNDVETDLQVSSEAIEAQLSMYPGSDYETLINKPQINNVTLIGNISLEDVGIESLTSQDIDNIINN